MDARLISQPYSDQRTLFQQLQEDLLADWSDRLQVAVAWSKGSGLKRVKPMLADFRNRGGVATAIVGIDEGGASVPGLKMTLESFDEAFVLNDSSGRTFHPKLYLIEGQGKARLIVGSNNLTAGGVFRNYECSVSLWLNLRVSEDREVYDDATGLLERMREDDTCIPLNAELIERLANDPRFKIAVSERRPASEQQGSKNGEQSPSPFGSSRFPKHADPVGNESGYRSVPGGDEPADQTASAADSSGEGEVVYRWYKKLSRSDANQPRPGSQTTAALRLTQGAARRLIDQASWFRDALFVDEDWSPLPARPGREKAEVLFRFAIEEEELGTYPLMVTHDRRREAGQDNFTTDIKWGPLTDRLRSANHVGDWVVIEKFSHGSYWMRIVSERPDLPLLVQ